MTVLITVVVQVTSLVSYPLMNPTCLIKSSEHPVHSMVTKTISITILWIIQTRDVWVRWLSSLSWTTSHHLIMATPLLFILGLQPTMSWTLTIVLHWCMLILPLTCILLKLTLVTTVAIAFILSWQVILWVFPSMASFVKEPLRHVPLPLPIVHSLSAPHLHADAARLPSAFPNRPSSVLVDAECPTAQA